MVSELKPCPFCGATAKLIKYYGGTAFTVGCDNLHRINTFETEAEAVATWNTRPTPVAPVSPDATGKCGELVTVGGINLASGELISYRDFDDDNPLHIPCCRKDRAEEILAAERAKYRDAMEKLVESQRETLVWQQRAIDLKADNERLRLNADTHQRQFSAANVRAKNMTQKCLGLEAKLAAEIRRERDLAEKQLSEVVDRMSDDYLALKAELDQAVGVIEDRSSEYEALEAKLAAAEKLGVRHE
ncbi:Lar family restriction alleviation protein [Brucella intermedia]|uniref:Lar family restriction alleviation protein n=1 Tax=Brucella intermedia TaxID=94625 RepID=UPI00235F2C13|nr:Lar family restriction alleviation protein [Brucella intermedia]